MKKILFVCTGNTCRSCMAEAIFNKVNSNSDIVAFSAGAYAVPNSKTSTNSAEVVLDNLNIDISDRNAVQLTEDMVKDSDLVFTMTDGLKYLLTDKLKQFEQKIFSLKEYVGMQGDVLDPYGGSIDVYRYTYEELNKLIEILVKKLIEDNSI